MTSILRNAGFWITTLGVLGYCLIGLVWSIKLLSGNTLYTEWLVLPMFAAIFGTALLILSNVTDAFVGKIKITGKTDRDFLCGTALPVRQALNSFADRMEEILSEADKQDRSILMGQILAEAERCELLSFASADSIRTNSPFVFVMDLLRESPDAYEWMSNLIMHEQQPTPKNIQNEFDLVAAITSPGI